MSSRRHFDLITDDAVIHHLAAIERRHLPLIRQTIEQQLTHQPNVETRNRKPLLRPSVFGSAGEIWELRFGPNNRFRVFYRVDQEGWQVVILAVGVKIGSRLFIGGEEFVL